MTQTLPVDQHLNDIVNTAKNSANLIISAEPGAGKTTRIPAAFLKQVDSGKIYVLEPRRIAAKLAAQRVASELGVACGDSVGYMVRFESMVGPQTRLIFLTEGLLVRMLRENGTAFDGSVVILDEFHERNLNTDLSLAMLRLLQKTSHPHLRIVVMSATLDIESLEAYFSNAASFRISGRTFPLDVTYMPAQDNRAHYLDESYRAVLTMAEDKRNRGHILVFLPGQRDILQLKERLEQVSSLRSYDVLGLYAELTPADQTRVFQSSTRQKIILATNVAETSVTIPGVTAVIDSGLAKIASFSPWSGMATLDLKRISKAACEQRAGRAGRETAGLVYRLYSQHDYASREAYTAPEVKRVDLNQAYLEAGAFALALDIPLAEFPWFQTPDAEKWAHASELLSALGATASDGSITEKGAFFLSLPIHPRLSAVIARGRELGILDDALLAAAIVHEGFLFREGQDAIAVSDCDVALQVDILRASFARENLGESVRRSLNFNRLEAAKRSAQAFAKILGVRIDFSKQTANDDRLVRALLAGFFDRVGKRVRVGKEARGQTHYSFCLGGGGALTPQSSLNGPDFILAIEAKERTQGSAAAAVTVWYASALTAETLIKDAPSLLTTAEERRFNEKSGKHENFLQVRYGQLLISEQKLVTTGSSLGDLFEQLKASWPHPFASSKDLDHYHARVRLLQSHGLAKNLPLFQGELFDLFLHSMLEGKSSLQQLTELSLYAYIEDQLSYDDLKLLNKLAPQTLRLDNKKVLTIHYSSERPPSVSGYIQDFFGVTRDLYIAEKRISVVAVLLAPNKRPAQTTSSLAGFWQNGYQEVKRELIRRYPRHFWPDDPKTAVPMLHRPRR